MSYHIGLQVLRAKVRGFHAAGTTITSRISNSEKERKHRLWDAKRKLGTHCRHHLIAYGLLRGLSYDQIERCAQNNKPDPNAVMEIMFEHAEWAQAKELTLERVVQLLTPATVDAGPVAASEPSLPATASPSQGPQAAHEKRA